MKIRASSTYQTELCPGSVAAQEDMPERPGDIVQLSGTRVHAADAGEDQELSEDEEATLESVQEKREAMSLPFREGFETVKVIRERQYAEDHFTGKPDYVELLDGQGKGRALLWDTKTGWREQTEPAQNLQVRVYAYLVFMNHPGVDEVCGGIVPARFKTPLPVLYSRDEHLSLIDDQIEGIWREASKPGAPRRPSVDACRFCKARATDRCPETIPMNTQIFKSPPESLIKTLTPSQKGQLLDECSILEGNIKIARERLREELTANPAAVEGWQLVPGDKRSSLPDVPKTFDIVMESGLVTVEEWQSNCLKVAQKPLQDLMKDRIAEGQGLKKNAAMVQVKELLAPVTVTKQNKESLEKKP